MWTDNKREARRLWRWRMAEFVVWLMLGLALHLLQSPLYWSTWILGSLALLLHVLWGIAMIGFTLTLAYADRRRDLAYLGLAAFAALGFFFFAPLWHWGDRLLFAVAYEARFDAVVANVQAGGPTVGTAGGFAYQASQDRSFVVFFWLEGIPDGGTAIIYDPESRLTSSAVLSGRLEKDILDVVLETPIECWDFTGPYSKCHYD